MSFHVKDYLDTNSVAPEISAVDCRRWRVRNGLWHTARALLLNTLDNPANLLSNRKVLIWYLFWLQKAI
jgi:hypothetical protein